MKSLFDYIFIRIYNWYSAKNDLNPDEVTIIILTIVTYSTLVFFIEIIFVIFDISINKGVGNYYKLFLIAFGIIIYFILKSEFSEDKIKSLNAKWMADLSRTTLMNGFFLFLILLAISITPIVFGIFFLKRN